MAVWPRHGEKSSEEAGHEKTRLHFTAQSAFLVPAFPSGAGLPAGFICLGEVAHLL